MKKMFNIAKLELSTLFYSPIAWLVLIVFSFQCGLQLTSILELVESAAQIGRETTNLTYRAFADSWSGGLFPGIQSKLYLYIPLLTMGLMSKETSTGTVKLLLSSPINIREIVLGKFVAMMIYGLILMMIAALLVIAGAFTIESFDWKLVFSGLLGIYLLLCAYSAIGLFMSCLTSYQVVAAISTLVVLGILNYIGSVGQDIDIVRDITYFLSISGRSDKMVSGLISTRDLFYFIIVISLFLTFSIYKLQSDRESSSFLKMAGKYSMAFVVAISIGYLSSLPMLTGYHDMTANKSRTLTEESQKVVSKIKEPVTITTYVNALDVNSFYGMPDQKIEDMNRFEKYTRFIADFKLKYVYYYAKSKNERLYEMNPGMNDQQIARKVAISNRTDPNMYLSPAAIKKIIDLEPEENRFVRVVDIGGKKTFLRMYEDLMRLPGETEITAALKRLIVTPPKVAFSIGHNERSIDRAGDKDYKTASVELTFRNSLINQGFEVTTVSLDTQDVPADISALVLADPKTDLSPEALLRLETFIAAGGNLLLAGEPGKQSVLKPVLDKLGVHFKEGSLVQQSKDFEADMVLAYVAPLAEKISPAYKKMAERNRPISIQGSVALTYDSNGTFNTIPLLITDKKNTWNRITKINEEDTLLTYQPENGDEKKEMVAALGLTRKVGDKDQRIIIMGDADFMSNGALRRSKPRTDNFAFCVQLFKWFSYGEFPINTSRPEYADNKLTIKRSGIVILKVLFMGLVPGVIIIFSTILLIRRKRR